MYIDKQYRPRKRRLYAFWTGIAIIHGNNTTNQTLLILEMKNGQISYALVTSNHCLTTFSISPTPPPPPSPPPPTHPPTPPPTHTYKNNEDNYFSITALIKSRHCGTNGVIRLCGCTCMKTCFHMARPIQQNTGNTMVRIIERQHEKTYLRTCPPSKDSDQHGAFLIAKDTITKRRLFTIQIY